MAGQGLLYVKVREGLEFTHGETSEDLEDNIILKICTRVMQLIQLAQKFLLLKSQ